MEKVIALGLLALTFALMGCGEAPEKGKSFVDPKFTQVGKDKEGKDDEHDLSKGLKGLSPEINKQIIDAVKELEKKD